MDSEINRCVGVQFNLQLLSVRKSELVENSETAVIQAFTYTFVTFINHTIFIPYFRLFYPLDLQQ